MTEAEAKLDDDFKQEVLTFIIALNFMKEPSETQLEIVSDTEAETEKLTSAMKPKEDQINDKVQISQELKETVKLDEPKKVSEPAIPIVIEVQPVAKRAQTVMHDRLNAKDNLTDTTIPKAA